MGGSEGSDAVTQVLVVDDQAVDRRVAGVQVEKLGAEAVYAEGGQEALDIIARARPDVVLTDLQMPGMGGLELVETIREEHADLPVILMTAFGSEDLAAAALRAGATNYLTKRRLDKDLGEALRSAISVGQVARLGRTVFDTLRSTSASFVLGHEPGTADALVNHLSAQLKTFGFCSRTQRMQMRSALLEALRNAIDHGNLELDSELRETSDDAYQQAGVERAAVEPYSSRRTYVGTELTPEKVTYVVRDEGQGFSPDDLPDPRDPENLVRASGRGVMLMRMFMDEVSFNEIGNEVTLTMLRGDEDDDE